MHSTRVFDVDHFFRLFAESLKPPPTYLEDGRALADKVFRTLRTKSEFSIAEVRFGGSFGKKTDVIEPDLDLVVVINEHDPPFLDVMQEFERILRDNADDLKINKGTLSSSKYVVHFYFKNGIDVDLLPAVNLDEKEVIQRISKDPEKLSKYYSSSLVRKQIAFMKSHSSSFLHDVVRLGKFWFKSLHLGEKKLRGGSCMMEMIGVASAVAEEEGDFKNESILRAFNRFLVMIESITSLKLVFKEVSDCQWRRVDPSQLVNLNNNSDSPLVPDVVGTFEILERECFMVEPANPYCDFLVAADSSVLEKLMTFASVTKQKLSDRVYSGGSNLSLVALFDPLPSNLKFLQNLGNLELPRDIYISYDRNYSSVYSKMKIRKQSVMNKDESKLAFEILKQNLTAVVNATVKGNSEKVTTTDVANAVENMTERNLQVKLTAASRDTHKEMDVTLTIPYEIDGVWHAVKYSMQW